MLVNKMIVELVKAINSIACRFEDYVRQPLTVEAGSTCGNHGKKRNLSNA
jgi:hypothetical protein